MTQAKHTPWFIDQNGFLYAWDHTPEESKTLRHVGEDSQTSRALLRFENATQQEKSIIKAAPELLEALRGLYDSLVKEVSAQGPGYSEENLLCLSEFKNAKVLLNKFKGTQS